MTTLTLAAPMVLDHDGDKYTDGLPHRRRVSDRKGDSLEARLDQLRGDFEAFKNNPGNVDADRLRLGWKEFVIVVGASVSIMFVNYRVTEPLSRGLDDVRRTLTEQKKDSEAGAKLTEERMNTMREKVDTLGRDTKLLQLKADELTNKVLDMMRRVR